MESVLCSLIVNQTTSTTSTQSTPTQNRYLKKQTNPPERNEPVDSGGLQIYLCYQGSECFKNWYSVINAHIITHLYKYNFYILNSTNI